MKTVFTPLVVRPLTLMLLLAVVAGLTPGGRVNPILVERQEIAYPVPRLQESKFVFEHYLDYAQQLAVQWDEKPRLESVVRRTSCATHELTAGQTLLINYWRPTIYWFGHRIEWFEFDDLPNNYKIWASMWSYPTATPTMPPLDMKAVAIRYSEAIQTAFERGGTEYIATHPACYLAVRLDSNGWQFIFSQTEFRVDDDLLKLCVDSRTGEPCDFPDEGPHTPPIAAKCERRHVAPSLRETFGAQSAKARMIDDETIEVAMWLTENRASELWVRLSPWALLEDPYQATDGSLLAPRVTGGDLALQVLVCTPVK